MNLDPRGLWRTLGVFVALVVVVAIGALVASCQPAKAPAVEEAGIAAAGPLCTLIENVIGTDIESLCASAPEIAQLVAVVVPLIAMADKVDAGHAREACKNIPTTNVCATPLQLHAGFVALIHARQDRELVDGGLL